MSKKPQLWVVAGPNGAGKSTLVEAGRFGDYTRFVNPDVIAKEINPNYRDDTATLMKAGKIARKQHKTYMASGESFGLETTLSGHSIVKMMREAKEQGYKVHLAYVGLINAALSSARVDMRVSQGGHGVPEDAINRRYQQSLDNLGKAAQFADRLYILDNTEKKHRVLLNMEQNKVKYVSKDLPKWAQSAIAQIIENRIRLIPSQ